MQIFKFNKLFRYIFSPCAYVGSFWLLVFPPTVQRCTTLNCVNVSPEVCLFLCGLVMKWRLPGLNVFSVLTAGDMVIGNGWVDRNRVYIKKDILFSEWT